MLDRRSFLRGAGALLAAPAIVRAVSLMPVFAELPEIWTVLPPTAACALFPTGPVRLDFRALDFGAGMSVRVRTAAGWDGVIRKPGIYLFGAGDIIQPERNAAPVA